MFFSPFSIVITSLREKIADLCASLAFIGFAGIGSGSFLLFHLVSRISCDL